MLAISSLFLVVFGAASVYPTKVPCDLSDKGCLTDAANILMHKVVAGKPEIGLRSSDPLKLDLIEADLPTVKYSLSNANFHGMDKCRVKNLNIDLKTMSSLLYMICPRLTLDSNYFIKGTIGSIEIEGKGTCKVDHEDYHIGLLSSVETFKSAAGKVHLKIKSFELKPLEVHGRVVYKFENLFDGNKEKSDSVHESINKEWKAMSAGTQEPAMKLFMGKFVENINTFMNAVPIDEMFYKDV